MEEVQANRGAQSTLSVPRTSEVLISGIPPSVPDIPKIILEKVFLTLGVPKLTSDIL